MIAPPSNLPPVRNLDPFDCGMLPCAQAQCQAQKVAYADAVKPDCSRLPPAYQPYCRALQPTNPAAPNAPISTPSGQTYDPALWPNTGAVPAGPVAAAQLAQARQCCASAATRPREFFSCLWATTKYPAYPEFNVPTLTTRDNCPCRMCAPRTPFPNPGPATGGWTQVSPKPYDCAHKPWGEIKGLNTTPKTWQRK